MDDHWQGSDAKEFLLKILSEAVRVVGMDTHERSLLREFTAFVENAEPLEVAVILYKDMLTAVFSTSNEAHNSYSFAVAFKSRGMALSYGGELVAADISSAYAGFVKSSLKKYGKALAG